MLELSSAATDTFKTYLETVILMQITLQNWTRSSTSIIANMHNDFSCFLWSSIPRCIYDIFPLYVDLTPRWKVQIHLTKSFNPWHAFAIRDYLDNSYN